jgi:bifunctional non-homologous end joining protein LigD
LAFSSSKIISLPHLLGINYGNQLQGKVVINRSQNAPAKTMVAVYFLRARENPTVSFPLDWPELEQSAGQGDPEKLPIMYAEAIHRVEKQGDLF